MNYIIAANERLVDQRGSPSLKTSSHDEHERRLSKTSKKSYRPQYLNTFVWLCLVGWIRFDCIFHRKGQCWMLGLLILHYTDRKAARSRGCMLQMVKYNLVACLYRSPRPWKVRVALTHVTVERSHTVRVAHSTSNTHPPRILLICDHLFLHAIKAWHRSIHHCVTARCLHSDTDITLQRVRVEQASFHASPAYCCECNLSLVWVMMAVKSSSLPLLADVLFF